MKMPFLRSSLFSLSLFVIFVGLCQGQLLNSEIAKRERQSANQIVAIVNDAVITRADVDHELAPVLARLKETLSPEELQPRLDEYWQTRLAQIIENKILLQEAYRQEIRVAEKQVEERFKSLLARAGGDITVVEDILAKQGLTIREQKKKIHESIIVDRLLEKNIGSGIYVSPAHIEAYYAANMDKFSKTKEIKIQHLLVKFANRGEDAAKTLIDGIYTKILAKKLSFDDAVTQHSESQDKDSMGKSDFFKKGNFLEAIEKVAFELKEKGSLAAPIQSHVGWHIVQLVDTRGGEVTPIEKVSNKIRYQVRQKKFRKLAEEWILTLKQKAFIKLTGL